MHQIKEVIRQKLEAWCMGKHSVVDRDVRAHCHTCSPTGW